MALYDFTLAAGGVQQIDVVGDSVVVKSSNGPVEVRTGFGYYEALQPGQGWADFPFNRLYVRDLSGGANRGILSVYRSHPGAENPDDPTFKPRLIDNRITGDVSIIDGGKTRSIAGSAFWQTGYQGAAGAGNLALVQLLNPAAATKRVIIKQMDFSAAVAQGVNVRINAAPLTLQTYGAPKQIGLPSSIAEVRVGVVASGSVTGIQIYAGYVQATQVFARVLQEPVVLLPGFGVVANNGVLNGDLQVGFEWYEESL